MSQIELIKHDLRNLRHRLCSTEPDHVSLVMYEIIDLVDLVSDLVRVVDAVVPKVAPARESVSERQEKVRRHYAARKRLACHIYSEMSLGLDQQRASGEIDFETAWLCDDANLNKVHRIQTKCEVMRDARIAKIKAEAAQS